MANFTAYRDVGCVYPISGQYGQAPRALYYTLLLFVVLFRRQDWLTAGAAAFCLTFGGSAAIHSAILAPKLSLGFTSVPDGKVQLSNSTIISHKVEAVALDLDSDAILAIVGTGFLIAVPMALWSSKFRSSGAVAILVLWMLLMFAGMLCCMLVMYGLDESSAGPLWQYRFCTIDYQDPLPFSGTQDFALRSSWNETIHLFFENQTSTPSCYYPCLNAIHLLRQPGDAVAVLFLDLPPPYPSIWGMDIMSAGIYGWVPLNMSFSLVILILRLRQDRSQPASHLSFSSESDRETGLKISSRRAARAKLRFIYSKVLTPLVFVVFLYWVECIISWDIQGEEIQMVGQWAPLVGASLAFIAAIIGKYGPVIGRFWLRYSKRRAWVKREGVDEGLKESWVFAREFRTEKSAWRKYWERREMVKRGDVKESIRESWKYARSGKRMGLSRDEDAMMTEEGRNLYKSKSFP